MKIISLTLLVALLALGTSEGLFLKKPAPTEVGLVEGVKTAAEDLKNSVVLKKKAVTGVVSAVSNAKHDLISKVTDAKLGILKRVVSSKVAAVRAIKNGKVALVRGILAAKMVPIRKKVQLIKEIRENGLLGGHSWFNKQPAGGNPVSGLISKVFSKFSGHSKGQSSQGASKDEERRYFIVPVAQQPVIHVGTYTSSLLPVIPQYSLGPEHRDWFPSESSRFQIPFNPITSILRLIIPPPFRPSSVPAGVPSVKPSALPVFLPSAEARPLPPSLQVVETSNTPGKPCHQSAEAHPEPLPPVFQAVELQPGSSFNPGADLGQASLEPALDQLELHPEPLPPVLQAVELHPSAAAASNLKPQQEQSGFQDDFQPEPLPPGVQTLELSPSAADSFNFKPDPLPPVSETVGTSSTVSSSTSAPSFSAEASSESPILEFLPPRPSPIPAVVYGPPATSYGVPIRNN